MVLNGKFLESKENQSTCRGYLGVIEKDIVFLYVYIKLGKGVSSPPLCSYSFAPDEK
jgi:hypothetical protein